MNKQLKLTLGLALAASMSAQAAILTTAISDTYSYVFAGTNSSSAATVNVSQYNGGGHFTFGVIEFDTSSLNTSGDKFLQLSAAAYTDGSEGATPTSTGSYEVNVGVMPLSFTDYLNSPSDAGPPPPGTGKLPWFNSNILPLTPIGTLSFQNTQVESLDVTGTVNDWINGANNFGFVLWNTSDAGSVQINSIDGSGFTPSLNNVPEPQTYAMIGGILALTCALYRRRTISK